jgi:propanol-preferring alcohol dehydrogenase
MKAMVLHRIASLDEAQQPLELCQRPIPDPGRGCVLIRVSVCGVCHTELDEIEGRTAPPRLPVIPGHQVVGVIEKLGTGVIRHRTGERVGVGWIHSSSGGLDENLSPQFVATGRDADGGYAEFMTVPEDYAYPIPAIFTDAHAAPLLCAGAVGYRALRLTGLEDGDPLGLTGFGGSAHLVLQMARHLFPHTKVYIFARDPETRRFALELGAVWAGDTTDRAPEPLQAIIDTTPAWKPVVEALANLRPGGRLVINAIRKEERDKAELERLNYSEHLWMEREIKTVANVTQHDLRRFLPLAAEIPLRPEVQIYRLEDANQALLDLKRGFVRGAKVLTISAD